MRWFERILAGARLLASRRQADAGRTFGRGMVGEALSRLSARHRRRRRQLRQLRELDRLWP
jgi:hypothetical protein